MARPLRIAMFLGTFPVISETFILRQITGLIDLGHWVDLFANSRPDPSGPVHPEVTQYRLLERTVYMEGPAEALEWEMPVYPLAGRTWPPGAETSKHNSIRLAKALPKLLRCLAKTWPLTRQVLSRSEYGYQAASLSALYRLATLSSVPNRYDVLHAHFGPVGRSFRFARRLWQAPLCVSFHGYDFSTLPRLEGTSMYHKLFPTTDAVTVNSRYTRTQVERLGCPSGLIHHLPVGLDLAQFPFQERRINSAEPVRVLTVGRLVPIKGHEYLIRAVAQIRERGGNVCLDIVGDGPQKEELASLIRQLKMDRAIVLHGALDGPGIKRLSDRAHLFVLASVSIDGDQEGQGLALQEAQASGMPVIATLHGALPEGLLDDESGFLVPERDVSALVERITYLVTHPERWVSLGRKGREFVVKHFDIHKLNHKLIAIYESLIEMQRNGKGE